MVNPTDVKQCAYWMHCVTPTSYIISKIRVRLMKIRVTRICTSTSSTPVTHWINSLMRKGPPRPRHTHNSYNWPLRIEGSSLCLYNHSWVINPVWGPMYICQGQNMCNTYRWEPLQLNNLTSMCQSHSTMYRMHGQHPSNWNLKRHQDLSPWQLLCTHKVLQVCMNVNVSWVMVVKL